MKGGSGWGKERSKICVESVDRKPQLENCLRQMKAGCGSATNGTTLPSDLDLTRPQTTINKDLTLAAKDKLCPPPSGGRHRMTDDERYTVEHGGVLSSRGSSLRGPDPVKGEGHMVHRPGWAGLARSSVTRCETEFHYAQGAKGIGIEEKE